MRQIYILFAVLFLFSINQAFSQQLTNTYIADKIVPLMEKVPAGKQYIPQVKELKKELSVNLETLKTAGYSEDKLVSKNKQAYNQFRKKLTTVLPIEVFSEIFDSEFSARAKIISKKLTDVHLAHHNFKFSKEQITAYYDLIYSHIRKEWITQEYYAYQPKLLNPKKKALKIKRKKALLQFIQNAKKRKTSKAITTEADVTKIIASLKEKATKENIDVSKVDTIVNIYKHYTKRLKLAQAQKTNKNAPNLVNFNNPEAYKKVLAKNLKSEIKLVLTFKEFKALFSDQFALEIKEEQHIHYKRLTQGYTLDNNQKATLKKVIDRYAEEQVIAKNYYSLTSPKRLEESKKLRRKNLQTIDNAFEGLGLAVKSTPTNQSKVAYFLEKAKKAKVSPEGISKLKEAIKEREKRLLDYQKKQRKDKNKFLITFKDKYYSKDGINKLFRKRMASILTLDQFSKIFGKQLEERIKRETLIDYKQVLNTYKLDEAGKTEIKKIIYNQKYQEIIIQEYYGYNYKLAKQKLRALQYKFEKKYQRKILELTK